MNNNIKVIVLADNHFNSLGIIRSLGEKGINPIVVLISDQKTGVISSCKYAKNIFYVNTIDDGIDLIIKNYKSKDYKPFIITGSDVMISAIDKRYEELSSSFITFNCGQKNGINNLLSKHKQNELAEEVGFNIPKYEEVMVGELPTKVNYPIITKAIDSTIPDWKKIVYLCNNEFELQEAYKKISCKRVLLQEYIDKDNETGFNGISINSGEIVYLPLQLSYHYTNKTSFGDSIYLFPPSDNDLLEKIRDLIKRTHYSGIFSIDFLKGKDGKIYFLEINFRNSAWSYPYTRAGINLPFIWITSTLNGRLNVDSVKIKKTPYTSMVELQILSKGLKQGLRNIVIAIYKVLKSDSYIYFRINDLTPFFFILKNWIKHHIKSNNH